jgi:hypothetical protein
MTDFHRIERAEGIFPVAELDWDNTYYTALLDGRPYAYLHTQSVPGQDFVMLHITLLCFSRRVLRECLSDYVTLKKILKGNGIKRMIHLKDHPVCQWEKLMHLLGFSTPKDIAIEGRLYKTVCEEVL